MNATIQKGVWTSTEPMSIRVRVDHLDIHRKRLKGTWYADTLISKVTSILGNTVSNVYTQGELVKVYTITARREARQPLIDFTDDVDVPEVLLTDEFDEFNGRKTEFLKVIGRYSCSYRIWDNIRTIRTTS